MQNIFTNIKCSEIILYNANENWYIILYDLFSRSTCRKNKKLRFFLILIEQVMTNLLKKN